MKTVMYSALTVLALSIPTLAHANHGPGTTGGGANTQSGETIKEGAFVFSLDENYTNYENVSREETEARGARSGAFDSLRDGFVTSTTLGYGITDDFQMDASIGWYSGQHFVEAHGEEHEEGGHNERAAGMVEDGHEDHDHGHEEEPKSGFGNPEGLTDLMVRVKYRLLKGPAGHLAIIAGGVFPTGKDDEYLDNGEKLEPSSQPGSGRYSTLGGLAYSKYLTPHVSFDLSSLYTYRFERRDFRIGDRWDNGAALSYRLTESPDCFPQLSVFAELNHQYIGKDDEDGTKNINSGGNLVYVTPGVRVGIQKDIGVVFAPSIPVIKDLNGDQLEPDFRLMSSMYVRF